MLSYKIIVNEGLLNKELYVLNSSNERIWSLKSHDSLLRKVANFHLRVKLSSVYFIYNNDDQMRYQYIKNAKNERLIINNEDSLNFQIEHLKHLGDKFFRWSNGEYELYSSNQTTVHIKTQNKIIGSIGYSETKSNWKVTEDIVEIKIEEEYEQEMPIIVLLYVNEFYQNGIGGQL